MKFMRWKKDFKGSKITDTRGARGSSRRVSGNGILSLLPVVFKLLGVKGTVVVALLFGAIMIFKPSLFSSILSLSPSTPQTEQTSGNSPDAIIKQDAAALRLISYTKDSNDRIWRNILGRNYTDPSLHLVNDRKGTGPYYMPRNQTIYIDPQFFVELATRHDSPGDFAQAYVLAHETAHHVQRLTGYTDYVHRRHGRPGYNQLSVRLELYADFLAGVWAHNALKLGHFEFEEGDLEEAINAANNIGDDVLMKKAGAWKIDPSKFTHGTGDQRKAWLLHGFRTGDYRKCDLFAKDQSGRVYVPKTDLYPN